MKKEKYSVKFLCKWESHAVCKVKFYDRTVFYYNTINGRFIYKGVITNQWFGKKSLVIGAPNKKEFCNDEHKACKWLMGWK